MSEFEKSWKEDKVNVVHVSGRTRSVIAGDAIAKFIRNRRTIEMEVEGAGGVSQAMKAIAIVRVHLYEEGIDFELDFSSAEIVFEPGKQTLLRHVRVIRVDESED